MKNACAIQKIDRYYSGRVCRKDSYTFRHSFLAQAKRFVAKYAIKQRSLQNRLPVIGSR